MYKCISKKEDGKTLSNKKLLKRRRKMNISNMKNIVVLKNLPSNLVEEAIVVLKENKKVHKYQVIDINKKDNKKIEKEMNQEYVIREAELLVETYIKDLESRSSKNKNTIKNLEKKYKKSIILNFFLGFSLFLVIIGLGLQNII